MPVLRLLRGEGLLNELFRKLSLNVPLIRNKGSVIWCERCQASFIRQVTDLIAPSVSLVGPAVVEYYGG